MSIPLKPAGAAAVSYTHLILHQIFDIIADGSGRYLQLSGEVFQTAILICIHKLFQYSFFSHLAVSDVYKRQQCDLSDLTITLGFGQHARHDAADGDTGTGESKERTGGTSRIKVWQRLSGLSCDDILRNKGSHDRTCNRSEDR